MSGTAMTIGPGAIGVDYIGGNAATLPMQGIIPSYAYQQYSDDENILAFVAAYNALANGYLAWFNATALGVYTSPAIAGPLLDWTATGIYGIARPTLSSSTASSTGALNSHALDMLVLNGFYKTTSGTAVIAPDDIYKRVLTWHLFRNDGQIPSIPWLRKRVNRFIYGYGGSDASIDTLGNISLTLSGSTLTITVPSGVVGTFFQQAVNNGILALPFQLSYTVSLA
jgi:hypothetical protein